MNYIITEHCEGEGYIGENREFDSHAEALNALLNAYRHTQARYPKVSALVNQSFGYHTEKGWVTVEIEPIVEGDPDDD